jgi:UDP-N-acetyl-D-glucosamine dehydrogenase
VAHTKDALVAADAVVIVTEHAAVDYQLVVDHADLVVDTRRALKQVRPGKARVIDLTSSRAPVGVHQETRK